MTAPTLRFPISPELEAAARAAHEAGVRQLFEILEQEAAHLMARRRKFEAAHGGNVPDALAAEGPADPAQLASAAARTRHLRRML